MKNYMLTYSEWCNKATADADLVEELKSIAGDEAKIEDAFYRNLAFGTGGLRGVIGAGTNRMNIYTVAKASQGLANYVNANFDQKDRRIAVSYDSRIKADLFAKVAAGVFAANGIKVFIYTELMPTPCLSYAVRELNCAAGVMVTASHNPAKYNGYKVYGSDGCQITTEAAAIILEEIEKVDIFEDVRNVDFEAALQDGSVEYISGNVYSKFINEVLGQSLVSKDDEIDKDVATVTRALKEAGYTNITLVEEQKNPDGNFPTCPYPNPEIKEAMALGMEYAKKNNADLLLATDPDCDRVGIAVKNSNGEYVLLTGNQTGCLLLDYVCSMRMKNGTMPQDAEVVKTIVTTDLGEQIAASYGVKTVNVLTGFKFIGEEIGRLEKQGKADSYIFGFEESYGYLSGSYVRDKDAVDGAFLICEMFAYYKTRGISLLDKLEELYGKFGYCLNTLHSYEFEGSAGLEKMQNIMSSMREDMPEIGGIKVVKVNDYLKGIDGLPKSDVIKFYLEGNGSVVVRPSGTEPKMKVYVSISAKNEAEANDSEKKVVSFMEQLLK